MSTGTMRLLVAGVLGIAVVFFVIGLVTLLLRGVSSNLDPLVAAKTSTPTSAANALPPLPSPVAPTPQFQPEQTPTPQPSPTPAPSPTATIAAARTPTPAVTAAPVRTATPAPTRVPNTPTPAATAVPTSTPAPTAIPATPTPPGPTATPVPTTDFVAAGSRRPFPNCGLTRFYGRIVDQFGNNMAGFAVRTTNGSYTVDSFISTNAWGPDDGNNWDQVINTQPVGSTWQIWLIAGDRRGDPNAPRLSNVHTLTTDNPPPPTGNGPACSGPNASARNVYGGVDFQRIAR